MFSRYITSGKKSGRIKAAILLGVLTVLFITALSGCALTGGSIVILEDGHGRSFSATLKNYSQNNKCKLSLAEGDEVLVEVDSESGRIFLTVSGRNGSRPYTGNDLVSGKFTVTVSETDEYVFQIKGKAATGKITVSNLGPEAE